MNPSLLRTLLLLLLQLCLTPEACFAQVFRHISEKEGAPGGALYGSTQDKTGFMWFGTTEGLFKYDSHSFKYFKHDPKDTASVASVYINAVFCDSKGRVWIGTRDGLSEYDDKRECFKNFRTNVSDAQSITSDNAMCFWEDRGHNLWVGTDNGLNRIEITNEHTRFARFLRKGKGEKPYVVQGITSGKDKELWLATSQGLVWFDQGKTRFFNAKRDPRLPFMNDFTFIYNDESGSIWLGVKKGGLMRFDIRTQTFEIIENFKGPEGEWPDLSGFAVDKPGRVWIATTSGLANLDLRTRQSQWYTNDPSNDQSLADDVLMSIYKDRQGGLWLGSYTIGLDYLNTSSPVFSRWPFFINRVTESEFTSGWLGLTPDQNLWLLADNKTKILIHEKLANKNVVHKLDLDFAANANHFFVDENGVLWCGGLGQLWSYDFRKHIRKSYAIPNPRNIPIERSSLSTIIQDTHNRLWIGGTFGLLCFDKNSNRLQDMGVDKGIFALLEDSRGCIWAGGKNRVWIRKKNQGRFESIVVHSEKPAGVADDSWRFTEDHKGRIWLATSLGLRLYDPKNNSFRPAPHHLPQLFMGLYDVQADRNGYLWLNQDENLIRYHPEKGTIQTYNDLDGLPKKVALTVRGSKKDKTGMLFFNTSREMFSLNPDKVSTDQFKSPIVISSLRLFNKEVRAGDETGILHQQASGERTLTFRHDQNIFTLDFALLSYIRSHENKYRYRLEGFEEKWNEVSVPSATYMNLPRGTYTLVVQAANGDGLWMKHPLKLKIVILPPWWKTWYAYLAYLLLIAAGVYGVTRFFWIRSSFRKENALNQVKLDFFTNVSHEIRTHLSLINGPLEKAHQQLADGESVERNLSYARRNSGRLMLLVNELLDFRKIQSGSGRLQVGEHDVVKIIKSVIAAFEHAAHEKGIETSLVCPDAPVKLWFDVAQMQKVFYNLLSNAYKFTPDGGNVSVRITEISNEISIVVEDNGKGISAEHLQKLFTYYYQADSEKPGYGIGLALSKSIVEQHHGYLTAESRPAKADMPGSTRMTIRLLRDNRHFSPDQIASNAASHLSSVMVETITAPDASSAAYPRQKNTILVIEDNDELRAFISGLFEGQFNTLEAENGLRGLELANEHLPDVILSDVMMPGMNGVDVCKQLKSNIVTSHIPVVLLTARTQNEQIVEGLESGADDYLSKPFDPRILELKVNNLIRVRDELKTRYRESVLTEPANSIAQDMNEAFIARLRGHVVESISDVNFGVNELATAIGMSVSVLYRKMRSVTDMTVNEFVKSVRLNEARKLLESGVYNVNEVAMVVGFEDSKYFSKEFRKVFGKTPTEIRKQSAS